MKYASLVLLTACSFASLACGGSEETDSGSGGAAQGGAPGSGASSSGGDSSASGGDAGASGGSGSGGLSGTGGETGLCTLSFDAGLCQAAFPVFHFDAETGECIEKIYGGCGGNENRFDTKEECEAACDDSAPADCREASECDSCLSLSGCSWSGGSCASQCVQDAACFGAGNPSAPSCPD